MGHPVVRIGAVDRIAQDTHEFDIGQVRLDAGRRRRIAEIHRRDLADSSFAGPVLEKLAVPFGAAPFVILPRVEIRAERVEIVQFLGVGEVDVRMLPELAVEPGRA